MTESKYDSRVILTFVLRIPKVKLGGGRPGEQAVGARHPCPPWQATARGEYAFLSVDVHDRPPLRLPAAPRYKKIYTCAAVCFPVGLCSIKGNCFTIDIAA